MVKGDTGSQASPPPPPTASKSRRFLLAFVVLVTLVGCDQASKRIATATLQGATPRVYLGDMLRLEYALNSGGFLGMGGALSADVRFYLFIGFNLLLMMGVAAYLVVQWRTRAAVFVALLCILAGGVGNMIDRVTQNGFVIDFLNVGLGPVRTGIFNVADMGITFGVMALLLFGWNHNVCRQ